MESSQPAEGDRRRPYDPPWRSRTPCRELPDPDLPGELRSARLAHGWSLRQGAVETGISFPMLHKLEQGIRAPSVALAEVLAVVYELPPEVAERLLAVARPSAGRSSPYRR